MAGLIVGEMGIDIDTWARSLEAGTSLLPPALIAIALLGGPSAVWLLYRWVVKPRTSRYRLSQIDALWICAGCRSANDLRSSHCYRCHQEFDEAELEFVYAGSREFILLRPPAEAARPARPDRGAEPHPAVAASGRDPVAVGPGNVPTARRRRATVAGRASRDAPDREDPPAA